MFRPLATSALALILGAGATLADVTSAEVWENLERMYTDMGYQVEVGAREESGGTLLLENVVFRSAPETDAQFSVTFPQMSFAEIGDGTVRSVIEGEVALMSRATDGRDRETGFDAVMQLPGNETVSSGTAEDMRHVYTIPELRLTGTAVDAEGAAPLTLTMTDVAGDQSIRQGEGGGNTQAYDVRAASMELQVTGEGPALDDEGMPDGAEDAATDSVTATFRLEQLAFVGTGTTPGGDLNFDSAPAEALRQGLSIDGRVTVGPISGTVEQVATSPEGQDLSGSGSFSSESGEMAFALSEAGITFEGASRNTQVDMSRAGMPVPLNYAVENASGRLVMPLLASDEPQPFALSYALEGITLDEAMWSSFDPEAQLPRDPARLAIDLTGEAVIARDLTATDPIDPADPAAEEESAPILPRSLSVNQFALDALGATASLAGELTFGDDPSQPIGTLTGDFSGINQLLDRMVAMGVVPQEQLMGTRMMLAMFARPVEGEEDRLRTELEFREGGSIFANGQQVQ